MALLTDAHFKTHQAMINVHAESITSNQYWKIRCRESEIEWVANCISGWLYMNGQPTIITPTARGISQAYRILAKLSKPTGKEK